MRSIDKSGCEKILKLFSGNPQRENIYRKISFFLPVRFKVGLPTHFFIETLKSQPVLSSSLHYQSHNLISNLTVTASKSNAPLLRLFSKGRLHFLQRTPLFMSVWQPSFPQSVERESSFLNKFWMPDYRLRE